MKRSLNEVERICQKAAEGGGAPAGLDVEAAAGAAWLLARGFDVLHGLADQLGGFPDLAQACRFAHAKGAAGDAALDATDKAGALVAPLLVDLLLARAAAGKRERYGALTVRRLTAPLFLLPPAAAHAGDGWHFRLALEGPESRFLFRVSPGESASLLGTESWAGALTGATAWTLAGLCARSEEALGAEEQRGLEVLAGPQDLAAARARSLAEGVPVAEGSWARLQALAHKVLVPASEASRLKGAGARASDNE